MFSVSGHSTYSIFLPPTNEVWDKVILSEACVKNSVHRGGGGIPACIAAGLGRGGWCVVSQHALQVSRPTPRGGEVEGGIWPGGFPGPHPRGKLRGIWPGGSPGPHPGGGEVEGDLARGGLQAHTWGGLSQHALRQTPLRKLLLLAVRILLECILVESVIYSNFQNTRKHSSRMRTVRL